MNRTTDCKPEDAFRDILRAYGLISRLMQTHFARYGITGSKWGVLRTLHRAEGEGLRGLRQSDLGERLLVRPPSVTMVVGRLATDGLVAIRRSQRDRREKVVGLTDHGRRLVDRVLQVHAQRIDDLMSGLNSGEQRELHRLLGMLNGRLGTMVSASDEPARRRAV